MRLYYENILFTFIYQSNGKSPCVLLLFSLVPIVLHSRVSSLLFPPTGLVTLLWRSCFPAKRGNLIVSRRWSWDTTSSKHTSSRYSQGSYACAPHSSLIEINPFWNCHCVLFILCIFRVRIVHQRIRYEMRREMLVYLKSIDFMYVCFYLCTFKYALVCVCVRVCVCVGAE